MKPQNEKNVLLIIENLMQKLFGNLNSIKIILPCISSKQLIPMKFLSDKNKSTTDKISRKNHSYQNL